MNLSDKIKSIGALVLGFFFLFSCEELGDFGLGSEDIAPVEFLTTDLSVTGGQVLIDSLSSRGRGTILTGERVTPFGAISAKAHSAFYLELNDLIRPNAESTLDSVKMNLRFNYVYDDSESNRAINLKAYKVLKDFPDTFYVTSSALTASDFVVAQGELLIEEFDSTYSLNVDEDWGNEVFAILQDSDSPIFSDAETFNEYFPGVILQSDDPLNNIYGIETGSTLEFRFYISEPASDGSGLIDNREIAITAGGPSSNLPSPHFYSVDVNRSGTAYAQIQEPAIEYTANGKFMVHAGAGVVTKISLEELAQYTEQNEDKIINLVELTIGPIEAPEDGVNPPSALFLYFTDDQNTTISDNGSFRGIQQDGVNILSSQFPVRLDYDTETMTYKNSITSYVQNYYNDVFRRDFVFLYPSDMSFSVNGFELDPSLVNIKIYYSELR